MPKARQGQSRLINRRQQGDLGEASAIDWFTRLGATVFIPFGHSTDVDLVANLDHQLLRIQVKTSTQTLVTPAGHARYPVTLATNGGNQSWSGTTKRMDPNQFDYLFAITCDGRRWCVPAPALDACNALTLGGTKYSEFEIEPCAAIGPLVYAEDTPLDSRAEPGEYPSGQRTATVNRLASPSEVRILPPPLQERKSLGFKRTRYERKLGQSGQAIINPKRRVTVPQKAVLAAGLNIGDRLRVSAGGHGRLILERIELPCAAQPSADPAQPTLTIPAGTEPGAAA